MNLRRGTVGLFTMISVGLIILTVTMIFHVLPQTVKIFKIGSDFKTYLEINDQSGKIVPVLETKITDFSNNDIFACMIAGGDCEHDDVELDRLARSMNTKIILSGEEGEIQSYGKRAGDTLRVTIPLPGGKRGEIGIVVDVTIKEKDSTKSYPSEYGNCEEEGEYNYIRNHLTTIDFMGKNVDVNVIARDDFLAVVEDIKQCEDGRNYDFWRESGGGTYACRTNENDPSKMSMHAYGLAIDINPQSNPNCPKWPQCKGENKCITDIPQCVVDAFKSHNFIWGCDFNTVKDAMHFEWKRPPETDIKDIFEDNEENINREEGDEVGESGTGEESE
jgi:hypothetical protein